MGLPRSADDFAGGYPHLPNRGEGLISKPPGRKTFRRLVARTGIESKNCQDRSFGNTHQTLVNTGRNRLYRFDVKNRTTGVKPKLSEDFLSYFVMQKAFILPESRRTGDRPVMGWRQREEN